MLIVPAKFRLPAPVYVCHGSAEFAAPVGLPVDGFTDIKLITSVEVDGPVVVCFHDPEPALASLQSVQDGSAAAVVVLDGFQSDQVASPGVVPVLIDVQSDHV